MPPCSSVKIQYTAGLIQQEVFCLLSGVGLPPLRRQTSDVSFSTDADCNTDEVKQLVAADFDSFLQESAADSPCFGICDVGGQQVDCQPEESHRRKRSGHNLIKYDVIIQGNCQSALSETLSETSNSITRRICNDEFHPSGDITVEPVCDDNGIVAAHTEERVVCPQERYVLTKDRIHCGMFLALTTVTTVFKKLKQERD